MELSHLQRRRVAAHALNTLLRERGLGNRAHIFQGDQFADWDVRSDWEIMALIEDRQVAEVYLTGDKAEIVIPNWFDVIRAEHLDEFQPELYNLEIDERYDPVTRDKYPDEHVEMSIQDVPGLDLPCMQLHRQVARRKPRVVCSR